MKMSEYVDDISFQLGGGIVEVEIESSLPKCVNKAFRELKRYFTTPQYRTVAYSNTIDCSDLKVYAIINVMRSSPIYGTAIGDLTGLDVFSTAASAMSAVDTSAYETVLQKIQIRNQMSTDLDFIWEPETKLLRLNVNPPFPTFVTINYIPDYDDVEQVTEPFWEDFILKLATAYAKIVLGRIYSKYTLKSSQFELNGKDLLEEGNKERDEIITYIRENIDIVLPID